MPRHASLKPVMRPGRQSPWMLNVPLALSSTGRKQQLFFATRKEAETAAEQLKTRKRSFGDSLTNLNPVVITECAEAVSLIEKSGIKVSLLSLVKEGLARHVKRLESCTLESLFEQYLQLKQAKSPFHLSKLRACRNRFAGKGQLLVSDLTNQDFEPVLNSMTPSMRNSQLTLLNCVLNYGVRKELLDKNPLGKVDFIDLDREGEVEVFTPDEVDSLLHTALSHDKALLPFLVLGIYCGIRSVGELNKVLWSDVSLSEKSVTVRAEVSKTGNRRHIELSDNALEWLKLSGLTKGEKKLLPCSVNRMHVRRHALWQRVSQKAYPKNGMRHSFCSYWVAMHTKKEVTELLLMTGHSSPQMLWDHYYRRVEKAEAERFWSIYP